MFEPNNMFMKKIIMSINNLLLIHFLVFGTYNFPDFHF